jgi:hypothetical protein
METMYKNETASNNQTLATNKQEDADTVQINLLDVTEGDDSWRYMDRVYDAVKAQLTQNKKVVLSFKGMDDVSPGHLSLSVGKLYDDYLPEEIEQRLTMVDVPWHRDTEITHFYKMGRLYRYNKPEHDRILRRNHDIAMGNY